MAAINKKQVQMGMLLQQLRNVLRNEDYQSALLSNNAGEWGIAFEAVCAQLYEFDIRISRALYEEVKRVGRDMEMPPCTWEILESLVE